MKPKGADRRKAKVQVFARRRGRIDPKLEKKLLATLEQVEQDYQWIAVNAEKLKETHLNKFIAVKNRQVYFDSTDFEALLKVMKALKVDVDSYAIKRITKEPVCLLL